ncbi:MAG: hypothetical protein MZV64_02760 [Ignavibacteriales bacterium]|nr:hypothetical protein [Ignavibacteriales bacterium]
MAREDEKRRLETGKNQAGSRCKAAGTRLQEFGAERETGLAGQRAHRIPVREAQGSGAQDLDRKSRPRDPGVRERTGESRRRRTDQARRLAPRYGEPGFSGPCADFTPSTAILKRFRSRSRKRSRPDACSGRSGTRAVFTGPTASFRGLEGNYAE